MEKIMNDLRSYCVTPILSSRRIYKAPQVLGIIPYEPVMAGNSVTGGMDDTEFGGDWAKEQDFFFTDETEEADENPWDNLDL